MDPAPALTRAVAHLRAALAELEALATGQDAPRPASPERAWCLPAPGVVRWDGEATITLKRWHLLAAILDLGPGATQDALSEDVGDLSDSAFRSLLCRLNADLAAVRWPCVYSLSGGRVIGV